ncbi:MAG: hypothetical protein M3R65_09390 [Gemmatimonadota bacterium]|nr:hypothetical protein [Gemmatimonadota bacterium]
MIGAILACFAVSASGQGTGLCLHVPIMERDVSRYVKTILTQSTSAQLAAFHIPASDTSNVIVITDTATCRVVAAVNQRNTRADSLGTPAPVLIVRTGNPSTPASIRYIVWDNTKWGEYWSLGVFGPNFEFFNGFTM